MIWREKRTLLLLLGVLLVANTLFFFTYRVQYQSRLDALETRHEEAEGELLQARNARMQTERMLQSYRKVETDVLSVFNQHWSTQAERLTLMIAEVTRLTEASSLRPRSYTFDQGMTERVSNSRESLGASEVGIAFNVEGSYQQVRRLINLLELSRQFVIIDRIALAAGEGSTLTLTLHVKTLFRDDPKAVASNRL